jgi:phosphoglycerate dehydrogenase-like enzyme
MKIAVLDDYQRVAEGLADWGRLRERAVVDFFHAPVGEGECLINSLKKYDVLCLMRDRTDIAPAIERLPQLKLVVVAGAHNRALDVAKLNRQGVTVCNTRTEPTEYPSSELAWAHILTGLRNFTHEANALLAGRWQTSLGTTACGKTLGILGLGRIGSRMAAIGAAFGMNVVAWSPNLTAQTATQRGAERLERDEFFRRSDVVTLHLVLSDRTRGIVGARELGLMKSTSYIVNTSRGPLIDEPALIEALNGRRIAGAGLDVFDIEPLPPQHPYRKMTNVVLTPHLGFVTKEVYDVFFPDMIEDIEAYAAGSPVRTVDETQDSRP